MLKTISITVDGIVQGVFYRQSTKAKAVELGVNGQVKNKPDGTVHIIATGTEDQLHRFTEWCNKGPEMAIVTQVKVEKIPLQTFKGFTILKT